MFASIGFWLLTSFKAIWSWLSKLDPKILALIVVGFFAAYQWSEARHWHKRAASEAAGRKADIAATKEATRKNLIEQAARMLIEERKRTKINKEAADVENNRRVALAARYSSLWRAYNRRGPATEAPTIPDAAKGFDGTAGDPGLWCIPSETAFALMFQADKVTGQLIGLQAWVAAQAAVDPNVSAAPE